MVLVAAAVFAKNGTKPGKGWFTLQPNLCMMTSPPRSQLTTKHDHHTHAYTHTALLSRQFVEMSRGRTEVCLSLPNRTNSQPNGRSIMQLTQNPRRAIYLLLCCYPAGTASIVPQAHHQYQCPAHLCGNRHGSVRSNHMLSVVAVCTTMPFA